MTRYVKIRDRWVGSCDWLGSTADIMPAYSDKRLRQSATATFLFHSIIGPNRRGYHHLISWFESRDLSALRQTRQAHNLQFRSQDCALNPPCIVPHKEERGAEFCGGAPPEVPTGSVPTRFLSGPNAGFKLGVGVLMIFKWCA